MKNTVIEFNEVYSLIRKHYLLNFPYKLDFQAMDALNIFIKKHNENAQIIKNSEGVYKFENPVPTPSVDSPFENSIGSTSREIEAYLSDDQGLKNIFLDTNAMHEWLVKSGFIQAGVATEKMLEKKSL